MNFEPQIQELAPLQGVAFAAALCERMLPTYIAFSQARRWGKPDLLRQGIAQCWSATTGEAVQVNTVERMIERIAKVTPDSEDFGRFDGTLAGNGAISVMMCLELLLEYDSDKAASISENSTANVDAYLLEIFQEEAPDVETIFNHAASEKWVQESPMMQKELESQQALLDRIKSSPHINHAVVSELKETALAGSINLWESTVFPLDRTRVWRESAG